MKLIILIALFCAAFVTSAPSQNVNPAPPCNEAARPKCQLPDCRCSGTDIPGGLLLKDTPQLVFITFDDAVTSSNYPFYKEIFTLDRLNPNGHPITGTFFIAHEYSNYSMIHDLWTNGHEIALHSMTHNPFTTYWRDLNQTMWEKEVDDQRTTMNVFGRIPIADIKGFRAPFLQTGGDTMYQMLSDKGFQYECSRPTLSYRKPGLWPYTNNYESIQECQIPPCPIGQYNGFWTVPMVDSIGDNMEGCSMMDTCNPVPETQADMYSLLMRNFDDHYLENKAPFGIYIHAGWVNGSQENDEVDQRRAGFEQFIDEVLKLGDVYIVSVTRGVEWVKNPQNLVQSKAFPHFKVVNKRNVCPRGNNCHFTKEQTPFPTERYMFSCAACPQRYPWIGNPRGLA